MTISGGARTTTWEEFGITQELYNKYLSAILNREFPPAFNVKIGGFYCYNAGYRKANQTNTNYVSIYCNRWTLIIYDNGVAKINSNMA